MRNSTHLVFPLIISSEGYGTSLVLVVLLLSTLLALLSVSTILFIISLVVYVLLPFPILLLLFALFLLTVLAPVTQTLLVTTVCMALVIVSLMHVFTLPWETYVIREIRSTHTFIPHFSHSELEPIVSAAVSLQFLCTLIFIFAPFSVCLS